MGFSVNFDFFLIMGSCLWFPDCALRTGFTWEFDLKPAKFRAVLNLKLLNPLRIKLCSIFIFSCCLCDWCHWVPSLRTGMLNQTLWYYLPFLFPALSAKYRLCSLAWRKWSQCKSKVSLDHQKQATGLLYVPCGAVSWCCWGVGPSCWDSTCEFYYFWMLMLNEYSSLVRLPKMLGSFLSAVGCLVMSVCPICGSKL